MQYYRIKIPKKLIWSLVLISPIIISVYFINFNLNLNDKKAFVLELHSESYPLKLAISEAIKKNRSLDSFKMDKLAFNTFNRVENKNLDFIKMSEDGRLVMYAEKYGIFITLKPSWNGEDVRWSCYGEPLKYMPKECKKRS